MHRHTLEESKAVLKVARIAHRHQEERSIKKLGLGVPFSALELTAWLLGMAVSPNVWQCLYCRRMLVLGEVELDHKKPVSRGGSFAVENLCISCKLCNQGKGELTALEYHSVTTYLRTLDFAAEQYVLKCLRTAAMGARMRFFPRTKKAMK